MSEIHFDPEKHIYTVDGMVKPSVTKILGEWTRLESHGIVVNNYTGKTLPIGLFDAGADHGTAVHLAAVYLLNGQGLDWDALDPSLVHPLRELERWVKDYDVEPCETEIMLYNSQWDYTGTIDLIARVKGKYAVVDYKSGVMPKLGGPQTAAYKELAAFAGYGKLHRYVLRLPKTGEYKFKEYKDSADWAFFQARLFCHNYYQR